jgi:hypothetical protein
MKRLLYLALLFLLPRPLLPAGEPIDLGAGLSYVRVHALADSAPSLGDALAGKRALVIDVRYATATEAAVVDLRSALARHPAGAPLFVLISAASPAAVLDAFGRAAGAPVVTLGVAGPGPAPQVIVRTDAPADRRAYDAFDAGTPLDTLIAGKITKERFDEATLVKEFKQGNYDVEPPPESDPTAPKPANAVEKPAPLVDRVLQRAVQLQRALAALRP